jgi:hypothetical protein
MKAADPVTYLLRNVDADVWSRLRARADADGVSIRDALIALADAYGDGAFTIRTTSTTTVERARRRNVR